MQDYGSITYLLTPSDYIRVREWMVAYNFDIDDFRAPHVNLDDTFPLRFRDDDDMHIQFKLVFSELTGRSIKVTL